MNIQIGNQAFRADFNHIQMTGGLLAIEGIPQDAPRSVTTCCISGSASISCGMAVCHPPDIFCKATGRRIALTRALRDAGFNRAQRTEFWQAYHNRNKGDNNDHKSTRQD